MQLSSEIKNSHRQYNQQGFQLENITLNTEVGNLAANLYLPKGIANPPVVVVTGAWTSVKERWHVHLEAAKVMVEAGARLDLKGYDGNTPEQLARQNGYEVLAKYLLQFRTLNRKQ